MKNKFITYISLTLLASISFTSCNKDRKLKSISEEQAIALSKKIVTRQNESTFKLPSWFTYKYNYSCEYSSKLYETGVSNTSTKIYEECLFNIDDLMIKEIRNENEKDSSLASETYIYFDENKNQLVTLSNKNGKKIKSTKDMLSRDYAVLYFREYRSNYDFINDYTLINFTSVVDLIKAKQAAIKGKKDQYINVYYGSNDEKSLQLLLDQKLEISETKPGSGTSYQLTGYQTTKTNNIHTLDLIDTRATSYNKDLKSDALGLYVKDVVNSEEKYTYSKVKINLPNVDEYKEA